MAIKKPYPDIWYDIDRTEFNFKLKKLLDASKNLAPAFHTIGRMFRQSRKSIFKLKSPGGYYPLSPRYEQWKKRNPKSKARPFPILKLSGDLEKSVTSVGHPNNVNIVLPRQFAFGTNLWYAKYHNSQKKPRRKIPLRMFIFWGPEAPATMRNRTDETKNFHERAIRVLKDFLIKDGDK